MSGSLGSFGELWAVGYLARLGYEIVERNVRSRGGELDLIARDGSQLVFVEVKCRRSASFGTPEEAMTARKYALIERAALRYLANADPPDQDIRLDVIALEVGANGRVTRYNHLKNVESPRRDGQR